MCDVYRVIFVVGCVMALLCVTMLVLMLDVAAGCAVEVVCVLQLWVVIVDSVAAVSVGIVVCVCVCCVEVCVLFVV